MANYITFYSALLRCVAILLCCFFSSSAFALTCSTGWVSLTGSYYNNKNATGTVAATRSDTNINFNWVAGNPGIGGLGNDAWSIRWNGTFRPLKSGVYKFKTVTDDGVRLFIDGVQIIDDWNVHLATANISGNVTLVGGKLYTLRMDYFDDLYDASAVLTWLQPGSTEYSLIPNAVASPETASTCTCSNALQGGAVGDYYNNNNLVGGATNSRLDSTLDFNWGNGAPGVTGVGADNFSVRWNGTFRVSTTGTYFFQTTVDDGVRLWVNDLTTPVINSWIANNNITYTTAGIALTANVDYPIRLEYYEGSVSAIIRLQWKLSGGSYASMGSCPAGGVSYYGISHSGTGITCAGEPVTISAYDASGNLVAPSAGTVVTLSTAPATGTWVGGNTYTFSGTESSGIKYLKQIASSTLNINVTDGTYSESASLDPNISFVDSALKFYGNTGLIAMANGVAGTTNSAPILKAIRTDNNTGACVAQVTGTKTVSFGYECRNPTTCVAGQSFSVNGTGIQSNSDAATIAYSTQSLSFDASGIASIPLNYSDVGKVKVYAKLDLPATGNDPAITLSGNSGDIIFKPYTLAASAIQSSTAVANPGGSSVAGAAAGFVAAGEAFTVKVEARNSAGNRTPNFGNETVSENNIKFTVQSLVYPSGGTMTALSGTSGFTVTTPAGTFINTGVIWNQVGSITARPELTDNDYLSAGDLVVKTTTGTIGRFYPDHFTLASSATANACVAGGFSFLGQPGLSLSYQLEARGATNSVLTNYGGNYGGLATVSYVAENADSADGANYGLRLIDNPSPIPAWSSGVFAMASTGASVTRNLSLTPAPAVVSYKPDGPFTSLQWGLSLTDNFDLRSIQNKNMNPLTSGACAGVTCTAISVGSPFSLRYGRLRLDDAGGPETAELPVNFVSEYWTGNYFKLNANDSCTSILRSAITYPSGNILTDGNRTIVLSSGTTQGVYGSIDATRVYFSAGNAGHKFSQPNAAGTGSFNVNVNLSALSWLRYDWDQNGEYSDAVIPSARYIFGSYRGNDRVIYWHEKMQ